MDDPNSDPSKESGGADLTIDLTTSAEPPAAGAPAAPGKGGPPSLTMSNVEPRLVLKPYLPKCAQRPKEKTMSMSAKAILARFQGDYQDALEYARGIARAYPRLAEEYWRYVDEIGWERMKNTSLKRGEL